MNRLVELISGPKEKFTNLMEKLAGKGIAILFVSSEMEEVLGMADRVYVMHEGRISGELQKNQMSEESIMQLGHRRLISSLKL